MDNMASPISMKNPSEKVLALFEGKENELELYKKVMEQVFNSEYEVLEENVAKAILGL